MKENHFLVVEYRSFFAVRHLASGGEHPMGDGVDTLHDENEQPLSPGSPGFVEKWTQVLNDDLDTTYEAYFPSLAKEGIPIEPFQ